MKHSRNWFEYPNQVPRSRGRLEHQGPQFPFRPKLSRYPAWQPHSFPKVFSGDWTEWTPTKRLCQHLRANQPQVSTNTLTGIPVGSPMPLHCNNRVLRPNTTWDKQQQPPWYNPEEMEGPNGKLWPTSFVYRWAQLICSFNVNPNTSGGKPPIWFLVQSRHEC